MALLQELALETGQRPFSYQEIQQSLRNAVQPQRRQAWPSGTENDDLAAPSSRNSLASVSILATRRVCGRSDDDSDDRPYGNQDARVCKPDHEDRRHEGTRRRSSAHGSSYPAHAEAMRQHFGPDKDLGVYERRSTGGRDAEIAPGGQLHEDCGEHILDRQHRDLHEKAHSSRGARQSWGQEEQSSYHISLSSANDKNVWDERCSKDSGSRPWRAREQAQQALAGRSSLEESLEDKASRMRRVKEEAIRSAMASIDAWGMPR
jgi:hypothetical protein